MSPCSCQPVTWLRQPSNPLSTLRCCATLQVPEQDRVTDAQCSKEAPAVSPSLLAKGNCGRDSPCLSKKLLWGKIWSHYKYRRLNCGTARIWSIPTPCLSSFSPLLRITPVLHPCYYCTIAQPAGAQTNFVDSSCCCFSRSPPATPRLEHRRFNVRLNGTGLSSFIDSPAHGHAEGFVVCDANSDPSISLDPDPST